MWEGCELLDCSHLKLIFINLISACPVPFTFQPDLTQPPLAINSQLLPVHQRWFNQYALLGPVIIKVSIGRNKTSHCHIKLRQAKWSHLLDPHSQPTIIPLYCLLRSSNWTVWFVPTGIHHLHKALHAPRAKFVPDGKREHPSLCNCCSFHNCHVNHLRDPPQNGFNYGDDDTQWVCENKLLYLLRVSSNSIHSICKCSILRTIQSIWISHQKPSEALESNKFII